MSVSFLARRALVLRPATTPVAQRSLATTARRLADKAHQEQKAKLQEESKRNPEILVLGTIMVCAFSGAGYYFGRSPTASTSEINIAMAKDSMPWEGDHGGQGKYKYHPGADRSAMPKDAPSAINSTIVPDVILPKHLHEMYNKWGKDDA